MPIKIPPLVPVVSVLGFMLEGGTTRVILSTVFELALDTSRPKITVNPLRSTKTPQRTASKTLRLFLNYENHKMKEFGRNIKEKR